MQELTHTVRTASEQLTREHGRSPKTAEVAERLGVSADAVTEAIMAAGVYRTASLDRPLGEDETSDRLGDLLGDDDPHLQTVIDQASLRPLIAELNERDRNILMMRFFEGLSQREIAARLGYSQIHVSRLLTAICTRLRTSL